MKVSAGRFRKPRLASASDAAEVVQLHNGTEVVDVIPVYTNTEFVFIPDGYHVMLVGLKQELHVGDEIEVILQFRDHEDLTIRVPVGEATEHEHEHERPVRLKQSPA